MGTIKDLVFLLALYHLVHPGETLALSPILISHLRVALPSMWLIVRQVDDYAVSQDITTL